MFVPITNRFAQLLLEKEKREGKHITLVDVWKETHITRKTLYKWMYDEVKTYDPKVIDALCKYFGVDMSDLLEYTPPEQTKTSRK